MSTKREVRFLKSTEVRAIGGSGDADPIRIEGYASVFNTPTQLPGFRERVLPGAFTRAVDQKQDVVCLFNHDANFVLGRTTAGTLTLRQDDKGLFYTCDLPNTQVGRDTHTSIQRGDINGCSFAFMIPDGGQDWSEQRDGDGTYYILRDISDVDLMDVSPVTYPQYSGTNVVARCTEAIEAPIELRSAVEAKNKEVAAIVIPPADITPNEQRDAVDAIVTGPSWQDQLQAICQALCEQFPIPADVAEVYYMDGRFYCCDTYDDFVIACECGTGIYFKISYAIVDDAVKFGEPVEVEKTWVVTDRAKSATAEYESRKAAASKAKDTAPVVDREAPVTGAASDATATGTDDSATDDEDPENREHAADCTCDRCMNMRADKDRRSKGSALISRILGMGGFRTQPRNSGKFGTKDSEAASSYSEHSFAADSHMDAAKSAHQDGKSTRAMAHNDAANAHMRAATSHKANDADKLKASTDAQTASKTANQA